MKTESKENAMEMSRNVAPPLTAPPPAEKPKEILIRVQDTPNPNAWKFVLNQPVLNDGKATFSTFNEAAGNILATDLLTITHVKQVHFFQNVITITATFDVDAETLHKEVCAVIQTRMAVNNPNWGVQDQAKARREGATPEIQKIEEILDRTIRPGLQGDGGDIEIVEYREKTLLVNYQGACGTCPSATSGTLLAIESILKDEFDPDIQVIPIES